MTRKQREAEEDVLIERSLRSTANECDAEVAARGRVAVDMESVEDRIRRRYEKMALFAERYGHGAGMLRGIGTRTGRQSFGVLSGREAERLMWCIKSPFALDLMSCVETNS